MVKRFFLFLVVLNMIVPLYVNAHDGHSNHHHEKHADKNDILKAHLSSLDYQTGICIGLAMCTGLLALVGAVSGSNKTVYPVVATALLSGAALYNNSQKNALVVQHCLDKKEKE